jgi:hypothetical protein
MKEKSGPLLSPFTPTLPPHPQVPHLIVWVSIVMGGGGSTINDALTKSPFNFYLTPDELKHFQKCFLVHSLKAGEQLKFAAQLSADEMKRRNTRKQQRISLRTSFTEARSSFGSSFKGITVLPQEKDSRTSFRDASGDFVELCVVSRGGLTITGSHVSLAQYN